MGLIVASLQSWGWFPQVKEMLKRMAIDGASSDAASFRRRVGMPSWPADLVWSRAFRSFSTSSAVVLIVESGASVPCGGTCIGGTGSSGSRTDFWLSEMKKVFSVVAFSSGVVCDLPL